MTERSQAIDKDAVERVIEAVIDAARNVEWEAHFGARWEERAAELAIARDQLLAYAQTVKQADDVAEALELIYWRDWGWKGGGSDVRVQGQHGRLAGRILGFGPLPLGWPNEDEYARIAELRSMMPAGQ